MITYMPTPKDKEAAQAEFRALDQAEELMRAQGGGVSASCLWAYVQDQLADNTQEVEQALDQNPAMRKTYMDMIRSAALFSFPEAMAAAETDTLPERTGQGCKLSLKPSTISPRKPTLPKMISPSGSQTANACLLLCPRVTIIKICCPPNCLTA